MTRRVWREVEIKGKEEARRRERGATASSHCSRRRPVGRLVPANGCVHTRPQPRTVVHRAAQLSSGV